MAVNLSPVGGVAAQFFTSTGAVLTGGKLYTYAAGTTTPAVTYTSSNGATAWTNPVVLDAAGRVPGSGEIWLTDGAIYKFVLKDSNDVLIATYDNITGINSNSVSYTNSQEIITATAGQTVFPLTISYSPGTNSLSVFVDGVNQYGPGASYSYVETDSNTVTFNSGLHVGAEVKFTTTQQQGAGAVDASQVSYDPPFANGVATNVEAKLAEYVSVIDFGADPTGAAPSTDAFNNALAVASWVYIPPGTYLIDATISLTGDKILSGPESSSNVVQPAKINFTGTGNCFEAVSAEYGGVSIRNLDISGGDGSGAYAIYNTRPQSIFENIHIENWDNSGVALEEAGTGNQASWSTMVRQVKYIAPATATPYRGFQVSINGGHVTLDGCEALRGSIGINIDQGEAINVWRCSTNLQCNTTTYPFSSLGRDDQCGIRLSGNTYKSAVSIRECYIEAFTNGIYVEACESLSIEDNYIADSGVAGDYVGVPGSLIYLEPDPTNAGNVQNVTIRNNKIAGSGNGVYTVFVGENAQHVEIYNNDIGASGTTGNGQSPTAIYKEDGYLTYYGDNRFRLNPYVGVRINDAYGLLANMFWTSGTWTAAIKGSTSAGTYEIASQNCTYMQIGRQVTINAYITLAGAVTGGGTGNLSIDLTLLDIPTKTGKKAYGSAALSGIDYATAGASISSEADGTTHASGIWFAETSDAAAVSYVPISGVGANDVIAFSITYEY